MKLLLALAAAFAVLVVVVLWGSAWLKTQPWAAKFLAWFEPAAITLWRKSETIFFARLKMLTGILLMVLAQLGTLDLTPLMPFVPDQYEPLLKMAFNMLPLLLTVLGAIDERLRNTTSKPIEIVALPAADVSFEVALAVSRAESAKEAAVAVVAEAKAEGVV
jgi:hypothetical protein